MGVAPAAEQELRKLTSTARPCARSESRLKVVLPSRTVNLLVCHPGGRLAMHGR
jgi:hypothetical protein